MKNDLFLLHPPTKVPGLDNNWHVVDQMDTKVAHCFGFSHAIDEDSKLLATRIMLCLNFMHGVEPDVIMNWMAMGGGRLIDLACQHTQEVKATLTAAANARSDDEDTPEAVVSRSDLH